MAQNGGIKGVGQEFSSATSPQKVNISEVQQLLSLNKWPGLELFQNFYQPGTYSFSAPVNGVISYMAIGGGGAGDNGNSGDGGGGGGGGGCCVYASDVEVSAGDILTVVVGAGGSGPATKNTISNPGGNSSVTLAQTGKSNFVITATGGAGGKNYNGGQSAAVVYTVTSGYNTGTVAGGTNKIVVGYNGGLGGAAYDGGGGGGGAAGYGGAGGHGSGAIAATVSSPGIGGGGGGGASQAATAGNSGGGNGGAGQQNATGGGGGGAYTFTTAHPSAITTNGSNGNGLQGVGSQGGAGGFPGGGGGGSFDTNYGITSDGGNGFVRIVWGSNASGQRKFPSNAGDT